MKAAILQISDIHIKTPQDLALRYLPRAAGVMNELSVPDVNLVVVILAGDMSYSGVKAEYDLLEKALRELKSELLDIVKCEVHFIAIPGNHDCNFEHSNTVRDLLVKSIPAGNVRLSDRSVVQQCLTVQKEFWEFLNCDIFTRPTQDADHIYLEHLFCSETESLKIRMYNTAWVSQIHETPGIMGLPRAYFHGHDNKTEATISISVLHHPTHWFTPNRKREFDVVLDHSADMVMFGHEHLPEEYIKSDFDGNQIGYLYGGVFQNSAMDCPGVFNLVLVDTERGMQQTRRYRRSGDHFEKSIRTVDWVPYGARSPEIISGFRLSQKHAAYLEDAEVEFVHRSGRSLRLDDIYITPDFSLIKEDQNLIQKGDFSVLRGEAFDEYIREHKKLLIFGRERSGRTSLCKKIFWSLYRNGIVPILIHGRKVTFGAARDSAKMLQEAIYEAYDNPALPQFDQSNCKFRALIIDGFEASKLNSKQRAAFLAEMEKKFGYVIVVGDPLIMFEEIAAGVTADASSRSFKRMEIRELGRAARRRLIRRWYSIGNDGATAIQPNRIHDAEQIIDTLLGKSFLPAYPIFVLSFLQNIESTRPMDNIGSYGYHYEAFITNALSRFATQINLDIKYQFLSELAFRIFEAVGRQKEMETSEVKLFHKLYCEKYGIDPSHEELMKSFVDSKILEIHDGAYRFRYGYAYYFFVARYFRDHIDQEEIKIRIRQLSQSFHIEQNANIWLFLAHLSKSKFLLETLVAQAKCLFEGVAPITLENDIGFLRELAAKKISLDPLEVLMPTAGDDDNLHHHYDQLDKIDEAEKAIAHSEEEDGATIFARLDAMIRTIQVLGQVLKNFPGSLTANEKLSVVREAFDLGLRGLSYVLTEVEAGKDDLVNYLADRVARKYELQRTDHEVMDRVRAGLFWLLRLNVFGIIKIISQGVGARGEEVTYGKVVEDMGSSAAKLINISISLDTLSIPKKAILKLKDELHGDIFNSHLLSSLVAHHFYLFSAPNNVRHELCEKLNISIKQVVQSDAIVGDVMKRA